MSKQELIEKISTDLRELCKAGRQTVEINSMLNYLSSLEKGEAINMQRERLQHESNIARFTADNQHAIEMFRSVIDSGREATKASMLVNGGACVAILGFLSSLVNKGISTPLPFGLADSLWNFGVGVLACVLCFAFTYLTQFFYAKDKNRVAIPFHVSTIILSLFSYYMFLAGVCHAHSAFRLYFSTTN